MPANPLIQLASLMIQRGLVDGVTLPAGWGGVVKNRVIPVLKHPKLRHHLDILTEGFDRFQQPLSVLVVGEGKFGKSTLVNALLGSGREIAKTDFLPKTWHITRYIRQGNGPVLEIHYDPTVAGAARLEEFDSVSVTESKVDHGVITLNSVTDLDLILNSEEAAQAGGDRSAIWQVVRSVEFSNSGNRSFELIDSPGISQTRASSSLADSIEDFYHRADVVLWLIAADKCNSSETVKSLESMSRYSKPIIGVVNRFDLVAPEDREAVLTEVSGIFNNRLDTIVPVSAKNAFDAIVRDDREAFQESGFSKLEKAINILTSDLERETKAQSLYHTSRQAAREAGDILRKEADILDRNIKTLKSNLNKADSFQKRAVKRGGAVIERQTGNPCAAIAETMKNTFRTYGDENTPLFNLSEVSRTIREEQAKVIGEINKALNEELEEVLDEIAVRPYTVQLYKGDGSVKSHEARSSTARHVAKVSASYREYQLDRNYGLGEWIADAVRKGYRGFVDLFGEPARDTVRERQKADRERSLKAYVANSDSIETEIFKQIREDVKAKAKKTAGTLSREVQACFDGEFESLQKAGDTVSDYREKANLAVVPPALVYTVTARLRESLS